MRRIDAGDAEAALGRALAHRPGGGDVGPGDPGDQRAHRHQEDADAEQVDHRLGPRRGGAVEDVAADVAVVQQRVAGRDHEQRRVHVDDRLLHLDRAEAEDVAQHDHDELQQHDQQREPGDRAAERLVGAVDRAREALERLTGRLAVAPPARARSVRQAESRAAPAGRAPPRAGRQGPDQPYWNGSERAL